MASLTCFAVNVEMAQGLADHLVARSPDSTSLVDQREVHREFL